MKESGFPESIQAFKFATGDRVIEATVTLNKFHRLAAIAVDGEGQFWFKLYGSEDESGKALIHLHIKGTLMVVCQSCLEPMPYHFSSEVVFRPVYTDEQAELLTEAYEPLMVDDDGCFELVAPIEDEILLCVPVAPSHEENCIKTYSNQEHELGHVEQKESRPNPFAVLKSLKGED